MHFHAAKVPEFLLPNNYYLLIIIIIEAYEQFDIFSAPGTHLLVSMKTLRGHVNLELMQRDQVMNIRIAHTEIMS